MRVLVTGAAGWIGSHVLQAAAEQGWEVIGLARPRQAGRRPGAMGGRATFLERDLGDWSGLAADLRECRPDASIHCAWYAEPGKYLTGVQNAASLANSLKLMELLAASGCRHFLGVGSCFEYAQQSEPYAEDAPVKATSLYAAAKIAASVMVGPYGEALGMRTTWARLFLQYGPGEDRRRLVPAVVASLLAGEPVRTTAGEQVRDFLHVADVARALVAAVRCGLGGALNIGSGTPVTVREVIATIADLIGRPELVQLGALPYRPGDAMYICADNSRLRTHSDWRPQFDLVAGLSATIDWWRAQPRKG